MCLIKPHQSDGAVYMSNLARFEISMNFIDVLAKRSTPVHLDSVSVAAALLLP